METEFSNFPDGWNDFLKEEKSLSYFNSLVSHLAESYQNEDVTPKKEDIYRALSFVNPSQVKVVILGQDPYPTKGVANGLAFSVSENTKLPQSLKNIYKELFFEYGYPIPERNGDLSCWAKQGVLLLNTSLTTLVGKPNGMKKIGWTIFTDHLLEKLSDSNDHKRIYLLLGNEAMKKESLLNKENSLIIKAVHPSPLSASRGFFHCGCFKEVNHLLKENGLTPINWEIEDSRISLF